MTNWLYGDVCKHGNAILDCGSVDCLKNDGFGSRASAGQGFSVAADSGSRARADAEQCRLQH